MRNTKAGKIADNLWYLGREESGIYLLEGNESSIIINGGLSYILPDVLQQMKDFGIVTDKIKRLLVLHSHFDHAGIVPYFKRTWPDIEICASEPAWKIFAMPKAIEIMNQFSQLVADQMGAGDVLKPYDHLWSNDITGTIVSEGDRIDLGGTELTIMETPGHSHCSITAFEPVMKALFASDAVGIPYRNTAFPSGNTNYTQFQETLERLKSLPVKYVCCDHYGYITGDEAATFVDVSIEEARKMRKEMEDMYRATGDIDAAAAAITTAFYDKSPDYFISSDILEGVFKQMVKHLSKSM
ncbi:MAG: MBL fold metallo-hydrolase [Deltaproteobacteria bacterium]|nr:MBL fold metallo-hydrolase [Deltaproteobacteria bacterium]MBN2686601.1 MBL fold metallo-hydrolase [Deltaproteobacteria bacterium]